MSLQMMPAQLSFAQSQPRNYFLKLTALSYLYGIKKTLRISYLTFCIFIHRIISSSINCIFNGIIIISFISAFVWVLKAKIIISLSLTSDSFVLPVAIIGYSVGLDLYISHWYYWSGFIIVVHIHRARHRTIILTMYYYRSNKSDSPIVSFSV